MTNEEDTVDSGFGESYDSELLFWLLAASGVLLVTGVLTALTTFVVFDAGGCSDVKPVD